MRHNLINKFKDNKIRQYSIKHKSTYMSNDTSDPTKQP